VEPYSTKVNWREDGKFDYYFLINVRKKLDNSSFYGGEERAKKCVGKRVPEEKKQERLISEAQLLKKSTNKVVGRN